MTVHKVKKSKKNIKVYYTVDGVAFAAQDD